MEGNKVVQTRNINQSSSTRLVIDDNLGSDANLTTNPQLQEEGNMSEPDENDDPEEPQVPTFAQSFKERKISNKGKGGKQIKTTSPKRLAGK